MPVPIQEPRQRLRQQAAREVSSEFSQSDSADYADLAGYLSAAHQPPHMGLVYMRRLDARSVIAGQLSVEEFRSVWGEVDPYGIVDPRANRRDGDSIYRVEIQPESAGPRYTTGAYMPYNNVQPHDADDGEGAEQ